MGKVASAKLVLQKMTNLPLTSFGIVLCQCLSQIECLQAVQPSPVQTKISSTAGEWRRWSLTDQLSKADVSEIIFIVLFAWQEEISLIIWLPRQPEMGKRDTRTSIFQVTCFCDLSLSLYFIHSHTYSSMHSLPLPWSYDVSSRRWSCSPEINFFFNSSGQQFI